MAGWVSGLASGEFWTLLGVVATAALAYAGARYQSRGGLEQAKTSAIREAVSIGSQLRDELRLELKGERERRRELEVKVHGVEMRLAETAGQLDFLKKLRCPRTDCPVFKDGGKGW